MTSPLALIETVRVIGGCAPLWPLHAARLARSAAALGLPSPDALMAPEGGEDRVVRLAWSADGGQERTERPVGSTAPVTLITARTRHPGYPHKTTQREAFDAARREAQGAGADDALLLTRDGLVGECAIWALGWWIPEGLLVPPLALAVLPSVARARLAEQVPVIERAVARDHLPVGAALVVCNAARGVVPVRALDGVPCASDPRTKPVADGFFRRG
jgi:branched-subunit amino acid aminotransferase/4-amino-4-deoxychorismate lyase